MKKFRRVLAFLVVAFCISSVTAIPASAIDCSTVEANCNNDICQKKKEEAIDLGCSAICLKGSNFTEEQKQAAGCDITNPSAQSFSTISIVLNSVYAAAAMTAIGTIIFGGFRYTVSQGDPGKVKKAKDTIMYAIIGLIIVLAAFAITNFILGAT